METFWEAVTTPAQSLISPSLCKESNILHQGRKKKFPSLNCTSYTGCVCGFQPEGKAHRGPLDSCRGGAECTMHAIRANRLALPARLPCPHPGKDGAPSRTTFHRLPVPACGDTSCLPAPGACHPTPASQRARGGVGSAGLAPAEALIGDQSRGKGPGVGRPPTLWIILGQSKSLSPHW